jgi:hypothetical protein
MSEVKTDKRGSKQCAGCQNRVGARTKICPHCGHEFQINSNPAASFKLTALAEYPISTRLPEEYQDRDIHTVVVSPQNECPVELAPNPKYQDTFDWVHQVREIGIQEGKFYSNSALLTFGRKLLSTKDFARFRTHIEEVEDCIGLIVENAAIEV